MSGELKVSMHEENGLINEEGIAAQSNTIVRKKPRKNLFQRYATQHIILAFAIALLCAYYALREMPAVANFATSYIAQPWHRFAGLIFSIFPFSVAELLCALAVVGVLAFLLVTVYRIIRKPEKLRRVYGALVTLLAGVLMFYALLCWLWGIGYYSYTYTELSGIETEVISAEDLREVATYFVEIANTAAAAVNRDENGLYVCDIQETFNDVSALYTGLPAEFDFLQGLETRPKAMVFSYLMSHMNFTGMFFPLTGEANINVHTPHSYLPSTVAHELAHQRGVAREQDANFTAVVVCVESDDPNFIYSGALLAFTHLANALRLASYDDWVETCALLGEDVRRDLSANRAYWAQFQTPVADISETAYEEFLFNHGQEMGMRSYGACVDLLVAYYGEAASSH